MPVWNPWHGCHKISPGCEHCYVYRRDDSIGKDASVVTKTNDFDLPLKKNRKGEYKLRGDEGDVYACMTSDFFLDTADEWRPLIWDMIRERSDIHFHIITKRIERFTVGLPDDWGDGWENVTVCSTCENQKMADKRIPVLLSLPIKHREIISEPMLEEIDIEKYLSTGKICHVTCGGESGNDARPCDEKWVRELRRQCIRTGVQFYFKQTGALFIRNGRKYNIKRSDQLDQANKSGYSYTPGENSGERIGYIYPDKDQILSSLKKSSFRSRFRLDDDDRRYIEEKGLDTIYMHAEDFVLKRLSDENPKKDGEQTPMRGHPVFKAQHATACCCRACLEKWHNIPSGKVLNDKDREYITSVLITWIKSQL